MSASNPPYRFFRLAMVAVVCALPFLLGCLYLFQHVERVDTMPLDRFAGLTWMPDEKNLAFLHQPLNQNPPAQVELWRVSGSGTGFAQVGALESDKDWELTNRHSGQWMLLFGEAGTDVVTLLADGEGKTKVLKVDSEWQLLPSRGDGLFYQALDDDLPFDQFVDVEDAPDLEREPQNLRDPGEVSEDAEPPTRMGVRIGRYNVETDEIENVLSIPYDRPEERPQILLARSSPDSRFLSLVVKFGEVGSPGLWVYDSETQRLLWTRILVKGKAHGIDWSSDSVRIAITDEAGLSILTNVMGVESLRLELTASEALKPRWGMGTSLYLFNSHLIYLVDEKYETAQPLFDSQAKGQGFDDISLDAMGGRAAYTSAPKGYRELVVRDLRSGQNSVKVALPGSNREKAQGTIVYQMGNAVRVAWRSWTGSK